MTKRFREWESNTKRGAFIKILLNLRHKHTINRIMVITEITKGLMKKKEAW